MEACTTELTVIFTKTYSCSERKKRTSPFAFDIFVAWTKKNFHFRKKSTEKVILQPSVASTLGKVSSLQFHLSSFLWLVLLTVKQSCFSSSLLTSHKKKKDCIVTLAWSLKLQISKFKLQRTTSSTGVVWLCECFVFPSKWVQL